MWGAIPYLNGKTDHYAFGVFFSHGLTFVGACLLLGFFYGSVRVYRFFGNVFSALYLPTIAYCVASRPNLDFLNSVNLARVGYYALIPAVLLAADLMSRMTGRLMRFLPGLSLGFALLVVAKINLVAVASCYAGNQ